LIHLSIKPPPLAGSGGARIGVKITDYSHQTHERTRNSIFVLVDLVVFVADNI
jgi:hypothetical protein